MSTALELYFRPYPTPSCVLKQGRVLKVIYHVAFDTGADPCGSCLESTNLLGCSRCHIGWSVPFCPECIEYEMGNLVRAGRLTRADIYKLKCPRCGLMGNPELEKDVYEVGIGRVTECKKPAGCSLGLCWCGQSGSYINEDDVQDDDHRLVRNILCAEHGAEAKTAIEEAEADNRAIVAKFGDGAVCPWCGTESESIPANRRHVREACSAYKAHVESQKES